ncbi:MAG: bifunctional phosphopantothenoylcysteine decarboxylase/phosphopantothenate--cysteine ligase CoaBC [Alphaproteobacteria bacterium]|nr:bifunctional phosphopantothenoylcysteine decarboxylase/phosphopantothenate--cysteine ligase CoaBC [Alphaproteobacteria bacterium]
MTQNLKDLSILLVISGGIAAYKSLELIRLLKKDGAKVRCILTEGGSHFVTPLSVSALCEEPVYTDLWSLKDETEMGHIRLSREADLIVVAPASANIIAQMAHGLAQDLASTMLLAANKPILIAPAMNHAMWVNDATCTNVNSLKNRGIKFAGPEEGDMACGEHGPGRMSEPGTIFDRIKGLLDEGMTGDSPHPLITSSPHLKSLRALVTSGPTYESLDPVRFIGNRSSGKQGHAIAQALADFGADVTLVSGPTALPDPFGVRTIRVETAQEMLAACEAALPCDIAVCAAAVSDWRASAPAEQKIKKDAEGTIPQLSLKENPDILYILSHHAQRPALVAGFAAETQGVLEHAKGKLARKGCDWILANQVGGDDKKVFGEDENHVYFISAKTTDDWGAMSKSAVGERLTQAIADYFKAIKGQMNDAAE